MANFEGEKRLNRETSELEVKGKFKLSEEELDNVAGGCGDDGPYETRGDWDAICPDKNSFSPNELQGGANSRCCGYCIHFVPNDSNDVDGPGLCYR